MNTKPEISNTLNACFKEFESEYAKKPAGSQVSKLSVAGNKGVYKLQRKHFKMIDLILKIELNRQE